MSTNTRLNLGAGRNPLPGYLNLDIQYRHETPDKGAALVAAPVYPLAQYEDASVDEIRASHVLEHFGHTMTVAVLAEWVRVLKPGGILKIAVPDFEWIAREYLKGLDRPDEPAEDWPLDAYVMGGWVDEHDRHGAIFDESGLTHALESLGMEGVCRWPSDADDCSALPVSLNLMARKGHGLTGTARLQEIAASEMPKPEPSRQKPFEWLGAHARNVYSQTGEDGILEAIFARIGTRNRWCFECGAGDGTLCSNVRHLIEQGWKAVLVEADDARISDIIRVHGDLILDDPLRVYVHEGHIEADGDETVDEILRAAFAPKDIDLLVLDVDGQEWHLWNSMLHYRPRVMVVEYNRQAPADYVPPRNKGAAPHDTSDRLDQAGIDAIRRLGNAKGYEAVCATPYNLIFVLRSEIGPLLETAPLQRAAPAPVIASDAPDSTQPEILLTRDEPLPAGEYVRTIGRDVAAMMTVPRLMFTETVISLTKCLTPLGIGLDYALGVFWGQCLSRAMRARLNSHKYVLTVDYDSVFCASDALELYRIMETHPEIGALLPVQMKRSSKAPLFHLPDENGDMKRSVEFRELAGDAVEVRAGHFGLTILRTEALANMPHPWFIPRPDPETQEWDEGRCDEDVNFWLRWRECGNTVYVAPRVVIGHLEQCVTWPDRQFRPVYQHDREYTRSGKPLNVWR